MNSFFNNINIYNVLDVHALFKKVKKYELKFKTKT